MLLPRKFIFFLASIVALVVLLGAGSPVAAAAPGDVVINEIIQNPNAVFDNAGEWFELYNATGSAIDIDGWTIADNDIDSHVIDNGGPLLIPAGGFVVLGNNMDSGTNGGVTVNYSYGSSWFLSNGADEVVLLDNTLTEIDRVEYDGGPIFPDPTGASMALAAPNLDNNDGANWCEASTPYGAGDLGTPGTANDCAEPVIDVVINEIIQNPNAVFDSAGEWLELYNPTAAAIDIEGWTIADNDSDSHVIANGGPLLIPAGGYLVLGNNADMGTNGGAPVAYSYGSSWFLSNSADEVVLFDTGLNEIDRVEYDNGATFPDPTGASMALIDPALDNNVGANWCEASTPYGDGDFGTPGAANDCVTAVVEVVINEIIQNPSAVFDSAGEWFELYNPTAAAIDIDGWTIADNDSDSHVINNGGPLLIPAGGYLVLGNNADMGTNGGAPVAYSYGSSWFLSNSADEVVLFDGSLNEIDRVEYDNGATFPDPNGASMALIDTTFDNNVGANWCEASTPFGDGDFGTPGAANDCIATVEVVINEIIQNPNAVFDSAGEWFELYNPTAAAIDINGWTIADNDSDSHVIANGGPLLIPAGGYLVLGNNADMGTNGGAPVAYSYGSSWFLSNSADEVVLFDTGLNEIDRVEYDNGATFPDPTGASMSLTDPVLDNNVGANWCESVTPFGAGDMGTPGAENVCEIVVPPVSCDDDSVITPIHDIQGAGMTSLIVGTTVVIDGVVVGDFQNNASPDSGDLDSFYVQEEDLEADGNPLTSEGISVFAPGAVDVSPGDHVRVRGDVIEFSTSGGASVMTQLTNVSLDICTTPAVMPTATAVTFPVSDVTDFERYEGMLVTFPQALSISEFFNFDRFNEVVLTLDRQYQGTAIAEPGAPANAVAAQNALERITLDDGRTGSNPDPAIHPNGNTFDLTNLFRGGDTVEGATGVIDDRFGLYRIQPTQAPTAYTVENPRELTPPSVGGSLTVASFNVLNYFTTIDTGAPICGPLGNLGCRGADDANELSRQRAKILAALADIDADIVGLIELENHPNDDALIDLVVGLNDLVGAGTYAYVSTGSIGTDAIKVAFIYKTATVTPLGSHQILDSSVDPRFIDTLNRPVLAQTFIQNSNGAVVTVAVNHLKSKGSSCASVGDPDIGDGSGNCNLTRLAAAEAMVDWLASDPTGSGDADFLIIGDLNSYDKEDPIDAILAGSDDLAGTSDDYTDLNALFNGEFAYGYVFSGALGYLDYALSSNSLTSQVTGMADWHINADEPDILDYDTTFKQPAQQAIYEPNAFRSSDHDPVIVGLDLNAPPVCGTAVASQTSLWPPNHQFVDISILGVTDPDGDPFTITITAIMQDEAVNAPNSGSTDPDGMGVGTSTAQVRAERVGDGNGRVYHIFFTATDSFGNSCNGIVQVSVPISKNGAAAVDDGALFDSTVDLP